MNKEKKTIILTGASRGIGHATVKRFSDDGWRVITCSRQAVPKKCPWDLSENNHVEIDFTDIKQVESGAQKLLDLLGNNPLNALVNNAGISPKNKDGKRLDSFSTSSEVWKEVFQVNFFTPLLLAKKLKSSLQVGSGSIVNITSIAGSRVHEFAGAAYATSKAALAALTREMASDFGPLGIRVNAIAPGEITTEMISPESEKSIAPKIPLRRFGKPDEIAETIFFLCSEKSLYLNGSEIHVNGGQHV